MNQSEQLNELYAALAKAQAQMEVAVKDSANPFFKSKFADLTSVIRASRKYLTEQGLSVIQRIDSVEDKLFLATRLCHSSGQWIESVLPVCPAKPDIQALGSTLTYLKRYSYAALIGVVAEDEDDDGESAMERNGKLTPAQISELKQLLAMINEEDVRKALAWAQIEKIEDLSKEKFVPMKAKLLATIKKGDSNE